MKKYIYTLSYIYTFTFGLKSNSGLLLFGVFSNTNGVDLDRVSYRLFGFKVSMDTVDVSTSHWV
jgi:hypothetical protein